MDCPDYSKSISIIGTGDYGRAIGKRLIKSGYDVTFGSRRPKSRNLHEADECLAGARVTGMCEAICANDVIIFAVRVADFHDIAVEYERKLARKIVIDVSNRSKSTKVLTSNAEVLQLLLPDSAVVKAFNVISAYAMDTEYGGTSRVVPIATDNCQARVRVQSIAHHLGFISMDAGMLVSARKIEMSVMELFPMWRFPILTAFCVFVLWWVHIVYLYFIDKTAFNWEQLFVKLLNKPLCMTAITMLALTYLPGCLAGFLQLKNGTKHKRFPAWLDFWLKSRKQLGLTCFVLACTHAFISAMLLSPTYYSSWFHKSVVVIPTNMTSDVMLTLPVTSWMTWKGEIACLTGVLTFAILCIIAVTSLPTVADSMNWVEWRFVQSRLGVVALVLAVTHVYVMGMPAWIKNSDFFYMFHSITFMSSLLPGIVLLMRFILILPCLSRRLRNIRHGWEYNQRNFSDPEKGRGKIDLGSGEDERETLISGAVKQACKCYVVGLDGSQGIENKCFCVGCGDGGSCSQQCKDSGCRLGMSQTGGTGGCCGGKSGDLNKKLEVVLV